jgi:hypothetical protein
VIRGDIAWIRVVPLDPDELGAPALGLPLFQLVADQLYKVLVLDGPGTRLPAVLLPVDVPLGDALDRVLAVGADLDVLGEADAFEGAENACELGTLICLGISLQALRDVSMGNGSAHMPRGGPVSE